MRQHLGGLASDLLEQALAFRRDQRLIEAEAVVTQALALAADNASVVLLHAQIRYELGRSAAAHFSEALHLAPERSDICRNLALALASEGRSVEAIDQLEQRLATQPDWLDGQRVVAALRWTGGDTQHFDAGFIRAVQTCPEHQGLWLGWFSTLAQHRDWPRASAVLDEAERHLPPSRALHLARVFVAGESGDLAGCEALLAQAYGQEDGFLHLARIRLHLRRQQPQAALDLALPLAATSMAGQVWPYVSTCWRLLGSPKAGWLDGDPPWVGIIDSGLCGADLDQLAVLLRQLHIAQAPYADQSVRGGTQTDRSVLLRHEPILQTTRAALSKVVGEFVRSLPAYDPHHPLLSRRRDPLHISGSWSVRLGAEGYNVTHSHPLGWLSAVLYVSVPEAADMGEGTAGHFHLGAPPAELGLDLAPTRTIAPGKGKVVIFPSTSWHGTFPIAAGERLNIAFDVIPTAEELNSSAVG